LRQTPFPAILAAVIVGVIRILSAPKSFWADDQAGLAKALLTLDGDAGAHPLFLALARLVNVLVRDPLISLTALSVIASMSAAMLIALTAGRIFDRAWLGAGAALVALLSPAMLVSGPMPDAESVTFALVAATFYCLVERKPELFAVAAVASIGARPDIAPAMIAVYLIGLAVMPRKGRSLVVLAVSAIAVFAPLGAPEFFPAEFRFRRELAVRFIAHPWGGKFLSLPLLAAAAAGVFVSLKRLRQAAVVALAAFGAIHLLICILSASSFDGVQPMLPAILPVAFFAVAAFSRWPIAGASLAAVFAAASLAYAWPAVAEHARNEAPPVAAMKHVSRAGSRALHVIAAPDLAPFSSVALTPERLDEFAQKPGAGVQLVVHGRSEEPNAIVFERRANDVCRKLVSDRFHVVSVVPLPSSRRYTAHSGVYHLESSPERAEWRWLAKESLIEPAAGGAARLRFRLPDDAPLHSNRLTIGDQVVEIARGATVEIALAPTSQIVIRAERSFTAADGRDLSVQLISVSTSL
jgi:hypothetical protein